VIKNHEDARTHAGSFYATFFTAFDIRAGTCSAETAGPIEQDRVTYLAEIGKPVHGAKRDHARG